jgi:hypothetical protein
MPVDENDRLLSSHIHFKKTDDLPRQARDKHEEGRREETQDSRCLTGLHERSG